MTTIFLAVLSVVIPLLAWMGRQQLKAGITASRAAVYGQALVLQLLLGSLAWFTASRNNTTVAHWFHFDRTTAIQFAAMLLLLVALMAMKFGLRSIDDMQRKIYRLLAPTTAAERLMWIGICAVVAIVEEFVYRAVLFDTLDRRLESVPLNFAICSVLFGLAHLLQGWKGFLLTAVFAIPLHLLTYASGTITHAIIIHFIYDVIAGFMIARELRDDGRVSMDASGEQTASVTLRGSSNSHPESSSSTLLSVVLFR